MSSPPFTQRTVKTCSEEETIALGEKLGCALVAGDVVSLSGGLGAGKTTLTKGICKGLGVDEKRPVRSPTFAMINDYQGKIPVRHADLYRVEGEDELETIGLFDSAIIGVTIIEWGDKLDRDDTSGMITVKINDLGDSAREIIIVAPRKVIDKAGI
ncbi:TsaE protein, required for threonylcarbamoyladenosine t(6)A37 formation in tRNA [hydrothermal vent metagenome]|uniref:tRNA threonylcarbamoyladenosine biosynthesis protein TsaE n=1 Tax=hydrothermal vent metagenome TaxID=652676 RepID=A0A3B1C0E9_9ZZZZ